VAIHSDHSLQCALTKLSYLLSKPELSTTEVRNRIGIPLRGELTRPLSGGVQQATIDQNVENIQHLISRFVKLAQAPSVVPKASVGAEPVGAESTDAAAPWSWTVSEAATTEAALLPFLVHLAAAKDDVESLKYCLRPSIVYDSSDNLSLGMIPGGIVNCLEPGSGRSPLHVAALNGHARSVELLLRSGALVHLRDVLGHTALYLVRRTSLSLSININLAQSARQRHEEVVEILVLAGATLGGSDEHFANSIAKDAMHSGDKVHLGVWIKAGWRAQ